MSRVDGIGPTVAVIGAVIAFSGVAMWARMSADGATDPSSKFPRVAGFNARAAGWAKWLIALGVAVAIVGLAIWATS